jgi:Chitobiase/beta-hexosaminidase C-terminal domain/Bacterial Ig domain
MGMRVRRVSTLLLLAGFAGGVGALNVQAARPPSSEGLTSVHAGAPTAVPGNFSASTSNGNTATATAQSGKVVVIVEENEPYGNIVGNSQAPYLNQLIANQELFTNYAAVAPSSMENYLAMTSGLTTELSPPSPNLFQAIDHSGGALTWKEFMESMPGNCSDGNYANIPGTNVPMYDASHDPDYSYRATSTCSTNDIPMTTSSFNPASLPSLSYVVPNQCDDMHTLPGSGLACPAYFGSNSGTSLIGMGDSWLASVVPSLLAQPGVTVVITWDEGSINTTPWEHVVALAAGAGVTPGSTDGTTYTHYSLEAGLYNYFGLGTAPNNGATATPLPLSSPAPPPAPTISSFTPASGWPGTSVTVVGSGFTGTRAVSFNGTAAAFTVNSGTQLTATVPAGATTGPISVTTPGGTTSSTQAIQIQVDTTPPTTTIACNSITCSGGWYETSPVTVTLTATDNTGGSGVKATYYTTNGSTPTTSSPVYTAPFTVSATTTVKFFSVDNAGNAEAVNTLPIQIDTVAPTTAIGCNGAACQASYASAVQVALSATDNAGGSGVAATYYTTDGSDPTSSGTAIAYSAPFTLSQTATVKFYSIDTAGNAEAVNTQAIQIQVDTTPTTTIACNSITCSTGWYKTSPVTVTLTATDNTGGSGVKATYYTIDGSTPTTSSTVYAGPFNVSATTTVEFFSVDNAGNAEGAKSQAIEIDTVAPTTTISCNSTTCSTGWYTTSPVGAALAATDNTGGSGVNATYYTIDGSVPTTSSPVYTAPFTVSATTTVKLFSVDNAGNAEAVNSQTIEIDASAPTTTITCNGTACSSGGYNTTPVTVALTATDNTGGSGVAATYYTIDGSTPMTSSPVYTAPFTVSATATVKFFSVDNAGNAEAVKSQAIEIDTVAPTTTIACNSTTCSTGWYKTSPVTVTLTATDNTAGSGAKATYYTTNGSTPTTSSTVYTAPFAVSVTTTVKFFSVDNAGNAEAVKSHAIEIDTITPTTTITCNSTTCSTGWYKTSPVTVALTATDNTGGSGVAATYYTTDGTNPQTSTTAILYTGSFAVSQTTTVRYYSVDVAGNKGAVKSQTIKIDAAPPVVSITSPTSGSSFAAGTKVKVTASATDAGTGSGAPAGIASVIFYLGTTKLDTIRTSPYTFIWNTSKVKPGTYRLTAVATDNAGNSTTSTVVTVTVT